MCDRGRAVRTWLRAAAGLGVVAAFGTTALTLARHGEYAVPFTRPALRLGARAGTTTVAAQGAVVREVSPRLVLWAFRPEFRVAVRGGPSAPVVIQNALPLAAYQPVGPGVEPQGTTSLAIRRAGTFVFQLRAPEAYTFLVFGDPRGHPERLAAALERARGDLFGLCLGDLVADGDPASFERVAGILADSPLPVYLTVGNHDLEHGGRRTFRRLFGPENQTFDVGADRFVLLDTAADHPYLGDTRIEWLDHVLSAPDARYRFVAFHTPPLDPRPGRSHRIRWPRLREGLLAVLGARHVSVVFASHIHDYVQTVYKSTPYVVTGGLGADRGSRFPPHVLRVHVGAEAVTWERLPLPGTGSSGFRIASPAPPASPGHLARFP